MSSRERGRRSDLVTCVSAPNSAARLQVAWSKNAYREMIGTETHDDDQSGMYKVAHENQIAVIVCCTCLVSV